MPTTQSLLPDYIPPAGRRPPPEIVRELRDVVPEAELIYMGKGIWSLGTVRFNNLVHQATLQSITKIYKMLGLATQGLFYLSKEHQRDLHSRLYTLHLNRQGFRPIALYTIRGAPDSRVVEDLKEREWRYRTQFEAIVRKTEKEWNRDRHLEARQEKVKEYFKLEHKSIHRHAFRKAKSIVSAGIRKATDAITRRAS